MTKGVFAKVSWQSFLHTGPVVFLALGEAVFPPEHKRVASFVYAPQVIKSALVLFPELLTLFDKGRTLSFNFSYFTRVPVMVTAQKLVDDSFAHLLTLGAQSLFTRHQRHNLRVCEVLWKPQSVHSIGTYSHWLSILMLRYGRNPGGIGTITTIGGFVQIPFLFSTVHDTTVNLFQPDLLSNAGSHALVPQLPDHPFTWTLSFLGRVW